MRCTSGQEQRGPSFALSRSKRLVVHEIGSFVASYVPTRADFARLDPRFRLPDVLFDSVAHYEDYGFAVFQLAPGNVTVHPMGLQMPTRRPAALFFPTVHVHDGRFHPTAKFDHSLYYQDARVPDGPPLADFEGDTVSWGRPGQAYTGLLDERQHVVRRVIAGRSADADTWIAASA